MPEPAFHAHRALRQLALSVFTLVLIGIMHRTAVAQQPAYRNPKLSDVQRANDLLQRLRPSEKIQLLGYRNAALPRLGIPAYNWWNEGLHGVARAGQATVFPQAIGMAASFDPGLLQRIGDAVSTEARAKYNLSQAQGTPMQYFGLTFWSPNINLFRDPRWGRGQETYGEDPFLDAQMATAYIRGLQGPDPRHLKVAACAKHFAAYSGPEAVRHRFNAAVDPTDLHESYLYAFHQAVKAGVAGIMTAYNALNGVPCSLNPELHRELLDWGFKGYEVNDCGALDDVLSGHHYLSDPARVAAAALENGINLDCGDMLQRDVQRAIEQGYLSPSVLDSALRPLLMTQLRLGFYDPLQQDPYRHYGADSVDNAYHRSLARRMARESMVLLKNDGILPLDRSRYHAMLLAGPMASSEDALLGSYHGQSARMVDFVEGLTRAAGPAMGVQYDLGCQDGDTVHFGGTWASTTVDMTIAFLGISPIQEGEEGDAFGSPNAKGDRASLELPAAQIAWLKAMRRASTHPIVAVVTGGSDLDLAPIEPLVDAILYVWYPGEEAGDALADLIFGRYSPSGHLPLTFYRSLKDLPPFEDYAMAGRTYRYYSGPVEYPFGYGLTYTHFKLDWARQPAKVVEPSRDSLDVAVWVRNVGQRAADEVLQAYVAGPPGPHAPIRTLIGFSRVHLNAGEHRLVHMHLSLSRLQRWDEALKGWRYLPGTYRLGLGENSRDMLLESRFTISAASGPTP